MSEYKSNDDLNVDSEANRHNWLSPHFVRPTPEEIAAYEAEDRAMKIAVAEERARAKKEKRDAAYAEKGIVVSKSLGKIDPEVVAVGLKDPFAGMGFTIDDIRESAERRDRMSNGPKAVRLVCACGHSERAHDYAAQAVLKAAGRSGMSICKPGTVACLCAEFNSVAEVSGLRPFMQTTRGGGSQHALLLGMQSLIDSGGSVIRWTVEQTKCQMCGAEADVEHVDGAQGVRVTIYPINKASSSVASESTGADFFLCGECAYGSH